MKAPVELMPQCCAA